jgi:hypothetical protein
VRLGVLVLAALALVVSGAGCGDNLGAPCEGSNCTDARPGSDGNPDGPPTNDFTAFVHGQILNHTNSTEDPVPFAAFATLPDNDQNDFDHVAYSDLFP